MNNLEKFSYYMGTAGILIFSFFAFLSISLSEIGLWIALFAIVIQRQTVQTLKKDPVVVLFAIFSLYILGLTAWAIWQFPETEKTQIKDGISWLKLWFFICLAWWLKADIKKIHLCLFLALLGLLTGIFMYIDWSNPISLFTIERTGFHLKKPLAFSLYCTSSLLGLFIFAGRLFEKNFIRWTRPPLHFYKGVIFFTWLLCILLLFQALILTKARTTWIATVLVFPPALWAMYGRVNLTLKKRVIMGMCAVIILAVFSYNLPGIKKRVSEEKEVIMALKNGDLKNIPSTPLGYRIHLYEFGIKKWLESPIFGWGPGSTKYLVSQTGRQELKHPQYKGGFDWLDHLHNTYLSTLFRLGIAGAVILSTALFFILKSLWKAKKSDLLPHDLAVYLTAVFAITSIWCLTDFRALHYDWMNFWTILCGISYTFALHQEKT